jgi:hypothetical protein
MTIKVTFRLRGTGAERDKVVESPVIDGPIQICGMGSGPDGDGVMIEYEPDTRPPEVRAYDKRMKPEWDAQREREIRERSPFRGFTSDARMVLVAAQEARRRGKDVVEPEHLLVGIVRVSPETVIRHQQGPPPQ